MKKLRGIFALLILLATALTSCMVTPVETTPQNTPGSFGTTPEVTTPEATTPPPEVFYTVTLVPDSNITKRYNIFDDDGKPIAKGTEITKQVKPGESLEFRIVSFNAEKYYIVTDAGEYEESTEKLVVSNITGNMTIHVSSELSAGAVFNVSVMSGEGFTVEGDSTKQVEATKNATFKIKLTDTTKRVAWVSAGEYDEATGTLTVKNVRRDTTVEIGIGSNKQYSFEINGGKADKANGTYYDGTRITLSADREGFDGWTLGNTYLEGGTVLSSDSPYTLVLSADTKVYGNYNVKAVVYHMNGGRSPDGTDKYIVSPDTSFYTSPNSLFDGGGFTRDGYVLVEYNTKADGKGMAYSLGSKIELTGMTTDLYCIWKKVSTGFTTKDVEFTFSGQTFSGVAITGYSGSDTELVIPETIGGKKVIQINAGAIKNKSFTTLIISRNVLNIEAGAFTGCGNLKTVYFSDSVLTIPDDAFDSATYKNFQNFYINATTPPKYSSSYDGGYRVKWDRLMAGKDGKMIIFVSGSSSMHGVATEYLEALLDNEYTVVNYGTVRTTNNLIYIEAIANFVDEDDIVVYAPENSIYQFGCTDMTYKTYRDLEGVLNVFRYVDIRNYNKIFSEFTRYQGTRFGKSAENYSVHPNTIDENGDFQNAEHKGWCVTENFRGNFTITFNDQVKSTAENINNAEDNNWTSIGTYASFVKSTMKKVTDKGAKVYFGFCSVNANALTAEAKTTEQQKAFDKLITDTFGLEVLGSSSNHIYEWKYMYSNSNRDKSDFHLNDYGRAINTYRIYEALCAKLGITAKGMKSVGTDFDGCIFE